MMPDSDSGCSREALHYWLQCRGKTAHQAETVLHFGDDLITKFLRGKTRQLGIDKVQLLAAYLNVPTFALLHPVNALDGEQRSWGCVLEPGDDQRTMAEFSSLCASAEDQWTIHRGLNAYLMHPDHFRKKETEMLRSLLDSHRGTSTYESYLERAAQFYHLMRQSQLPSAQDNYSAPAGPLPSTSRRPALAMRSFHRVVTPSTLFDMAESPDWPAATIDHLKLYGLHPSGQLLLSILNPVQFSQLEKLVTNVLKAARIPAAHRWYAVNIIDRRFALIQTGDMTFACYHERFVDDLLCQLTHVVNQVDHDLGNYFTERPPKRELQANVNTRSRRMLEARIRSLEQRPTS